MGYEKMKRINNKQLNIVKHEMINEINGIPPPSMQTYLDQRESICKVK